MTKKKKRSRLVQKADLSNLWRNMKLEQLTTLTRWYDSKSFSLRNEVLDTKWFVKSWTKETKMFRIALTMAWRKRIRDENAKAHSLTAKKEEMMSLSPLYPNNKLIFAPNSNVKPQLFDKSLKWKGKIIPRFFIIKSKMRESDVKDENLNKKKSIHNRFFWNIVRSKLWP